MAVDEQAPLGEREAARPGRGGGWQATARSLLIGRPETGALFGAILMFVFFSFYADNFTTRTSLAGLASITAELGIVSMGVTLLMIAGHFDLSVGSVLGFSSVIAPVPDPQLRHEPVRRRARSRSASAISIGLVNGLLVVGTRIPSFIVTLGTLLIWRSVLLRITEGFPVAVDKDTLVFKLFSYRIEDGFFRGYQVSFLWFIAVIVLLSFLLLRTRFGNWIFASGGNERSARSMGVPVDRVWIILFIVTALCACLMGLIQVGRFNTVEATRGTAARAPGDRGRRHRRRPPERRLRLGARGRARRGDDRHDPARTRALGHRQLLAPVRRRRADHRRRDPQPAARPLEAADLMRGRTATRSSKRMGIAKSFGRIEALRNV